MEEYCEYEEPAIEIPFSMAIRKEGNRRMHEVAVMQGVVKAILQSLSQAGASRVTNVQLAIGRSGHFTEENARLHFEVLTKDTPAEGASLTISWHPATLQCLSCFHRFSSAEAAEQTKCPKCEHMVMEIEHQDTCYVSAIDVISEEEHVR